MNNPEFVNRSGERIDSVSSWGTLASPGEKRWRDHYSAKALAEAWIDGRGPAALTALLEDHGRERFDGVQLKRAVAEEQTKFDGYGGPRNHDLLVEASDSRGAIVVGLEGEVNESFGQTVDKYLRAATGEARCG